MLSIVIPCNRPNEDFSNVAEICAATIDVPIKIVLVLDIIPNQHIDLSKYQALESQKVTLVYGNYGSPGFARNAGIKKVKTKWVSFSDSDDLPNLINLNSMARVLESKNGDLAIGNLTLIDKSKSKSQYFTSSLDIKSIYMLPAFTRMIFKKSFVEKCLFPDLMIAEDIIFLDNYFNLQPKIIFCDFDVYTCYTNRLDRKKKYAYYFDDILSALQLLNPKTAGRFDIEFFRSCHCLSLIKFVILNRFFTLSQKVEITFYLSKIRTRIILPIILLRFYLLIK